MPIQTNENAARIIKIKPLHVKVGKPLVFPTIITQYVDTWTPNWRQENIYGRMDPFGFYGGTQRELTLGFRIISDNIEEAQHNMNSIQKLIQYQYPSYKKHGGRVATLKAPPYFNVQIMNIAQSKASGGEGGSSAVGLQGYFTSALSINPGFAAKDKAQYFNKDYTKLLFSDIEVVFRMMVLHSHTVGFYGANDNFADGTKYNDYPYNIPGGNPQPDGSTMATGQAPGNDAKPAPTVVNTLEENNQNPNSPKAAAKTAEITGGWNFAPEPTKQPGRHKVTEAETGNQNALRKKYGAGHLEFDDSGNNPVWVVK